MAPERNKTSGFSRRCPDCLSSIDSCVCGPTASAASNAFADSNSNSPTLSADFPATVVTGSAGPYLPSTPGSTAYSAAGAASAHATSSTSNSRTSQQFQGSGVGTVIAQRYELISRLGSGGMGTVFKARHVTLNKNFAVKILTGHLNDQEEFRIRFDREAKAASMLDHPNLVSISDYGTTEFGESYIVMDFVAGTSLAEDLASFHRLLPERAVAIFKQICDGLTYAHGLGLVHRDLKPANIMLIRAGEPTEQVKVIDFGIAKVLSSESGINQFDTKTNAFLGSPLYMSPEQCSGQKPDQRSDIYSMGCLMYECLTSRPPLAGENILATMMMHSNDAPAPFKKQLGIPAELEAVVLTALAKDPAARYQTMQELKRALSGFVTAEPKNETPPSVKSSKILAKPFSLWKIVIAVIAGGAIATTLFVRQSKPDAPPNSSKITHSAEAGVATLPSLTAKHSGAAGDSSEDEFRRAIDFVTLDAATVSPADRDKSAAELSLIEHSLLDAGRENEGIGYFKSCVEKNPNLNAAYDHVFTFYWSRGGKDPAALDKCIAVCTALLCRQPDNFEYLVDRAMAYRDKTEFANSITDLTRAINKATNAREREQAYLARAYIYKVMGNIPAAIADYEGRANVHAFNSWILLATCYEATSRHNEAIRAATEALKTTLADSSGNAESLRKSLLWAYLIRAHNEEILHRYADAIRDSEKALRLQPEPAEIQELNKNIQLCRQAELKK